MINTIVTGAAGRMGQRLVSLVQESSFLHLSGAIEMIGHPSVGRDVGEIIGCGHLGVAIQENLDTLLQQSDVIIDFTAPEATLINLEKSIVRNKAMVIGTTGFSQDDLLTLKRLAPSIPCVFAPNMSVGINVLLNIVGKVAHALGEEYNIEVIEAHHNQKKDAPSGTALKLAEVLAEGMAWNLQEVGVYARHGLVGKTQKQRNRNPNGSSRGYHR